MILTEAIHEYREVIRHLWNSYLRKDADWDTVDEFGTICAILFKERVLAASGISARPIPIDQKNIGPLHEYRLFAGQVSGLPLLAIRDIPASGYWDLPVPWIPPEKKQIIQPICLFDLDVRGWRTIQYYRARIVESESHPELNGRDALIECVHVEIEVKDAEPGVVADAQTARG